MKPTPSWGPRCWRTQKNVDPELPAPRPQIIAAHRVGHRDTEKKGTDRGNEGVWRRGTRVFSRLPRSCALFVNSCSRTLAVSHSHSLGSLSIAGVRSDVPAFWPTAPPPPAWNPSLFSQLFPLFPHFFPASHTDCSGRPLRKLRADCTQPRLRCGRKLRRTLPLLWTERGALLMLRMSSFDRCEGTVDGTGGTRDTHSRLKEQVYHRPGPDEICCAVKFL